MGENAAADAMKRATRSAEKDRIFLKRYINNGKC
jgi:hypothetical protein